LHGALLALVLLPGLARANPFFQDQTGQACVACHIAGMERDGRNGLNSVGHAFSANGNRMPTGNQNAVPQMPQQGSGEVRWFKIVSRNSDKVLDVTSASTRDGANVQQWDYAGAQSSQQHWRLEEVRAGPPAVARAVTGAQPNYARYAVNVDPIAIERPILTGKAANFRTVLSEALRDAAASGPNFAGHYLVAEWGCGSGCIQAAIIDTTSGAVHFSAPLAGATGGRGELDSKSGLEYRANSRLLLINGIPSNDHRYGEWAYEWTGTELRPQGFTPKRGAP